MSKHDFLLYSATLTVKLSLESSKGMFIIYEYLRISEFLFRKLSFFLLLNRWLSSMARVKSKAYLITSIAF